jgi:hypothetical protein
MHPTTEDVDGSCEWLRPIGLIQPGFFRSLLKGEVLVAEAAQLHGLTVVEVEVWRENFFLVAERALHSWPKDVVSQGRADQEDEAEDRGSRHRS